MRQTQPGLNSHQKLHPDLQRVTSGQLSWYWVTDHFNLHIRLFPFAHETVQSCFAEWQFLTRYSSQLCGLSVAHSPVLICTFLWCKANYYKCGWWRTKGCMDKCLERDEERPQQEITRAVFLSTTHSTKQLFRGTPKPKRLQAADDDQSWCLSETQVCLQRWVRLVAAALSKTTVHSVIRDKKSRLSISNI